MGLWLRRYWLYVMLAAILVAAGLLSYALIGRLLSAGIPAAEEPPAAVQEEELAAEQTPAEPAFRCPLDGTPLESLPARRPLAVMIDNEQGALPQAGLAEADLVLEALVEGGITRLMALYYHSQASPVGPVRSARPYFIRLAQGYGATYVHIGQSPQAQTLFKETGIDHIDEFGLTEGFWRDNRRSRPHNLYTDTTDLWQLNRKLGYDKEVKIAGFAWAGEGQNAAAPEAPVVTIYYPLRYNKVRYQYDTDRGSYLRFMGDQPHVDAESKAQLAPRNIIVQYIHTKVIDGVGRLKMKTEGEGQARVFSGGRTWEAKWEKKSLYDATRFYDAQGRPLALAPGQTWIELVPVGTNVEY